MRLLFDAQREHQHSSQPPSSVQGQPKTEPVIANNDNHHHHQHQPPPQKSLHTFWPSLPPHQPIHAAPTPPPASVANHIVSTPNYECNPNTIKSCEDCGAFIHLNPSSSGEVDVMDVDHSSNNATRPYGCARCGRVVCSLCSVSIAVIVVVYENDENEERICMGCV